jgi:hypothetical protein
MSTSATPRSLTTDEKKAAEAAFRGEPFDPKWSASARAVYEGIIKAMRPRTTPFEETVVEQPAALYEMEPTAQTDQVAEASQTPIMTREEAIQSGYLIDVTPIAQSIGLPVPVCLSKPLWDNVITASHTLPEEQHESRVRDVLVALRLRLATIGAASPAIAFPAMLPFPPEPVPQLCPLCAVAMGDQAVPYSLTILLANEVSAIIRPTGN